MDTPPPYADAALAVCVRQVEALASKHRAHLFETSAKQGEGVGDSKGLDS